MVFHLLDDQEIQQMSENQAKIKKLTTKLKRRKAFSDWDHGEMRPIGSRQPSGGRAGDGYSPYPATMVITQDDIHALFGYAMVGLCFTHTFREKLGILTITLQDIECILSKLEPHASSVVHEMENLGLEANVLGHYGVTAYHCWNYIAPQHFDKDATWTISYQLFKKNCMQDEFNFCFSHWGKLLETRENCAW